MIAISINKQNMKIYDANGFFAETPISTGMRGHPTPMGVFSVIAKEKLHHSNIYSGAPMPYMQRITWSGIAIHAGVLPGYPASHGCIRMPMAFAVKMYGWTRMGARVVITPDEMVPTSFSHPLLVAQKIVPQPVAADEPKADAARPRRPTRRRTLVTTKPATSEASLELRSTVGHGDGAKSADGRSRRLPRRCANRPAPPMPALFPTTKSPVTMSDATPVHSGAVTADARPKRRRRSRDATSSRAQAAEANRDATAEPAETNRPSQAADESASRIRSTDAAEATEASNGRRQRSRRATARVRCGRANADKVDAPKPAAKPTKRQGGNGRHHRRSGSEKRSGPLAGHRQGAAKPNPLAAPKRTGQIAVFVSRKDSKLYVRQNFAPLFDVPVTIAPSDRPLGTHVFTAEVDKDDANVLHWSVVSLPMPTRNAERRDDDERASRRRKIAGAAEMKALAPEPDSPAEALDRLTIPADAMARIAEALSTGSSIIVSDQGIAGGETGEGTDFIVSLR